MRFARKLAPWQKVNHFRNSNELCRKDLMLKNLKKRRALLIGRGELAEAKAYSFFPVTFELPKDYALFAEEFKESGGIWVMKPSGAAEGRGIFLFTKLSAVQAWAKPHLTRRMKRHDPAKPASYVVQRYISNPYLVGGKKFDLRIYVLVTSFRPLTVYIYRDGFAKFSSARFSTDHAHLQNELMHLTNHAVQRRGKAVGNKWRLKKFKIYVAMRHGRKAMDKLFWDIQALVVRTVRAVDRLVIHDAQSFELFGYDVLVDETLRPWLLEVNASPSLGASNREDLRLKKQMVGDALDIVDVEGRVPPGSPVREHVGGFDLAFHKGYAEVQPQACGYSSLLGAVVRNPLRQSRRNEQDKGKFSAFPLPRAASASLVNNGMKAKAIWSSPEPSSKVSTQQQEREREVAEEQDAESMEHMFDRTPTNLGRDVARMVRLNQDFLQPEIVDLVVRASKSTTALSSSSRSSWGGGGVDAFATVAKAYRKLKRQHLTLHLCEAFEEATGEPLTPSTPQGLVLLLDAMQPKTIRHARGTERHPGRSSANRDEGGERAVKGLLRRYEEEGKEVHMTAYKAAVKALDGPDCSVALAMAREARSRLGDSAEGLGEVYALVMNQCQERQAPDVMRLVLDERREAGGQSTLAPDAHAYASTLACFGKAKRVAEAVEIFGEMLEAGVKPSAVAVNNMLAACARDPDDYWMHAKTMFEGMEHRWGVTRNVYHYTSLVTCLLKAGRWSEAIATTDRMESDGITPNMRFLDHMMQASVGAKQWVTAEAIFRAMTEKYGHTNVVSRQSTLHFIQSMVMQKKLRKVISYVARVQDLSLKGPPPKGKESMDTAVLKWFRSIPGVGSEALAGVLMSMQDKGVRLHPDSYSVVISKANHNGNKELSATLYKMLVAGNVAPSLSAANAAIKGCATIDGALGIMASLGEHGLLPDKFTYAALLHCCSNAVHDDRQGQRATQAWEAMMEGDIVPHGGMLASYLLALMRSGEWKLALEVRERYRDGSEKLSHADRHVDKLDFMAREDAVVDGVMANGLVDNGQAHLALAYVLEVVKAREEEQENTFTQAGQEEMKRFVDEDNHTVLAGIRACKEARVGSCETAIALLAACEARWATGPLAPEADIGRERQGDNGEGGAYEWREMNVRTRLSRRRLYDCLVSVLDDKGQDFDDIRRVLERGMKNGAVSLMKDQLGDASGEQAVDFHGWSSRSARCIVRCIVQDLARNDDFLLTMGQYDLGRAAAAQGLREFGDVSERWHVDSPDPRGRRREFADGVTPARFTEREYGKGRKRTSASKSRWQKPGGSWDGVGPDVTQARWWEKEKRLSLIVGRPRPPPCIRNSVEEFCVLGVTPPLRVRKAGSNPGILTIEPEDVQAWIERNPAILT
eukprot:g16773.t1